MVRGSGNVHHTNALACCLPDVRFPSLDIGGLQRLELLNCGPLHSILRFVLGPVMRMLEALVVPSVHCRGNLPAHAASLREHNRSEDFRAHTRVT